MSSKSNLSKEPVEVLIVEDSPTQAEQLRHLLEQHHYRVTVAENGEQALALLGENAPTLVITDVLMPGMNGFELCQQIKADERSQNIPVILLTSLSNAEDVLEGLGSGGDGFITKPYSEDYLLANLQQILANRQLRKGERVRIGVEILFAGKKRFITADQQQMLTLLISTYEAAVHRNAELIRTQDELTALNERLEDMVEERTAALVAEITEHKRAEESLRHFAEVLRAVRNVNQLITHEKDRDTLLRRACEILTETRGYRSAWIGMLDAAGAIRAAAESGIGDGFVSICTQLERGEWPECCREALGQPGIVIMHNTEVNCVKCPLAHTYRDTAALAQRLHHAGRDYGVLVVALSATVADDDKEQSLFQELCGDISFALHGIEVEQERQCAEKGLRESQASLVEAQAVAHVGSWAWDTIKDEITGSDEFYRLFGVRPEQVARYRQFINLLHPDDCARVEQDVADAMKDNRPYDTDYRVRLPSGEYRHINARGQVFVDDTGKPIRMVGTCLDITERERAEHDLLASETRYRRLFESAKDGILILDAGTGKILDVNPFLVDLLGFDHEHFLGRKLWEIGLFKDIAASEAAFVELQEKGYIRYEDLPLGTRDGRRIEVEFVSNVYLVGSMKVVQCNIRDLTERKRAEEELRKLSMAVSQSPAAVIITDVQGNIEYVNPRFIENSGYTLDEVRGQNPRLLKSGETSQAEYEKLWKTITSGGEWRGEFHNKRKDGSLFWERAFISPIREASGTITHFLGIKEDITEQMNLEEQFRQAQKMEAIGRLAGGVAHDFNNILQAIVGYSGLLLDHLPEQDKTHEFADEIAKGADRAAALTRQLLAFSRRQVLQMEDLDLNEVIEHVAKMIRRVIGEDVQLKVVPGRRLDALHADRGQMEQVLLNLCVNARDAMPEGGALTIETDNVAMDSEYFEAHAWATPGRYVLISVADTGCGMDAETQARIFEPFFTTKELGKGTGLGLATVYGIVRQHQGMIQVNSEVEKGTTFKVYLPSVERTATTVGTKVVTRSKGGTETVLVAEDDETLRKLAVRILENAGYTVLLAADGGEAIDVFKKYAAEIDLVVLDVVMPKMSGKAVYDVLRQHHPRLRFLFSSGYSTDAIHTGFVLEEGIELIQKPYAPDALLRKVREVLDRTDWRHCVDENSAQAR